MNHLTKQFRTIFGDSAAATPTEEQRERVALWMKSDRSNGRNAGRQPSRMTQPAPGAPGGNPVNPHERTIRRRHFSSEANLTELENALDAKNQIGEIDEGLYAKARAQLLRWRDDDVDHDGETIESLLDAARNYVEQPSGSGGQTSYRPRDVRAMARQECVLQDERHLSLHERIRSMASFLCRANGLVNPSTKVWASCLRDSEKLVRPAWKSHWKACFQCQLRDPEIDLESIR
jgi:hypothetical protein